MCVIKKRLKTNKLYRTFKKGLKDILEHYPIVWSQFESKATFAVRIMHADAENRHQLSAIILLELHVPNT